MFWDYISDIHLLFCQDCRPKNPIIKRPFFLCISNFNFFLTKGQHKFISIYILIENKNEVVHKHFRLFNNVYDPHVILIKNEVDPESFESAKLLVIGYIKTICRIKVLYSTSTTCFTHEHLKSLNVPLQSDFNIFLYKENLIQYEKKLSS